MAKGIQAAAEARPAVIVVITDGHTPWPRPRPPGARTTIAVLTDHYAIDAVPGWIQAITVEQFAADPQVPRRPDELNRLGRTSGAGEPRSPTGTPPESPMQPPKSPTRIVKRVKRAAFGFTDFANYRIRALLYADDPDWALLNTRTPTQDAKRRLCAASLSRCTQEFIHGTIQSGVPASFSL